MKLIPMRYGIETDDPELKRMTIQQRGENAWAVVDECGFVLAKNGQWDYEPMPSSRTEKFIRNTRFRISTLLGSRLKS